MKRLLQKIVAVGAVGAATPLSIAVVGGAQTMGQQNAVKMDWGRSGTVEILVGRWSSDADQNKLVNTALEKGSDKLLETWQHLLRVGYIRTPDSRW
jgi:hypothetical protein